MTADPDAARTRRTGPSPAAVLLWLFPQAAALALASAGVRLWSHHPTPPESLAADELLVGQMAAAALLFPLTFPNAATTAVCLLLLPPLDALAAVLAGCSVTRIAVAGCWVAGWSVGFAVWLPAGGRKPSTLSTATALVTLTLPTLLNYVHAEAGGEPGRVRGFPDAIVGVLDTLHGVGPWSGIWAIAPLVIRLVGQTASVAVKRRSPTPHFTPPDLHPDAATHE